MSILKEIAIDISTCVSEPQKKSRTWKYGYNKEFDIVVISKDGTIGQIFDMDGMRIALPAVPIKKKIHNSNTWDLNKQRWTRKELPKQLQEIEDEASDQEEDEKDRKSALDIFYSRGDAFVSKHNTYIKEEFNRRKNGFWFMNNGTPLWVTGGHYMFMQWSYLQDSYHPHYRFPQWVLWVHWEACKADDRSYGQCYLKNRRSGYSTINMADNVDFATQNKSALIGIISKSGDDAQEVFMEMVTPVFVNYPFFFKPDQDGTTNPRRELAFRQVSKRITAKNRGGSRRRGGLNTKIRWWPTKKNSMDGKEVNKMSGEECGKWPTEVPVDKYWPIAKKCLVKGIRKVGKAMFGSTANAPDEGGAEFKVLYNWSKEETRSKITGATTSGMNSLFIPAQYNLEGFFDIWGNPILNDFEEGIENEFGTLIYVGAINYLKEVENQLRNDPDALNQQRRLDPTTERDAFLMPSENCLFDQEKIEAQMLYNESKINIKTGVSKLFWKGDLIWIEKYKTVKWVTNHRSGKCIASYIPGGQMANKMEMINGYKSPGNTRFFAAGIDSYDISATTDGRGSKGSLHIVAKNTFTYAPNQMVFEYCDRPANVDTFIDNCLKAVVLYGCQSLTENQKPKLLYDWKRFGFRKYSANRPDRKFKDLSKTERDLGGIPSSAATIPSHAEFIEDYILRYVGVNGEEEFGEVGKMGNCFFDELLVDWLTFEIDNREKFDRSVSSGYAIWLSNKIMTKGRGETKKVYKYIRRPSHRRN